MKFVIKECVAWGGGLSSQQDWQAFSKGEIQLSSTQELPLLSEIPAMQRRRLSPFAKVTLHCALTASKEAKGSIASVFASRHGDLVKTTKLIQNVCEKEPLSPTNFGLSVHNGIGGLFSLFTKNKAPLTAITAGEDTFFTGLLDALCKLASNNYKQIMFVYSESVAPEIYQPYIVQDNISIACALILEQSEIEACALKENSANNFTLNMNSHSASTKTEHENKQLQVLDFLKFYHQNTSSTQISSKRHIWHLTKGIAL
ncbi:MAG: beta-ketoacyl synthase chain length factor [Colwellia sp.]